MTNTKPQVLERAPQAPPPRRTGWIWVLVALAVVAAGVVATVILWPDQEEVAEPATTPAPLTTTTLPSPSVLLGELTLTQVTDVPSEHIYAVTPTADGFLAASPASVGGVDFYTSTDGESWELLVSDDAAFAANESVQHLSSGPAGFVAEVGLLPPLPEVWPEETTVWTSPDGMTWHRSDLAAGREDPGTPYLRRWFDVTETVPGPNGFVAMGTSGLGFDTDAILADFAPEASTAHYTVGEGPSTIEIFTEDGTELVVSYTELGITPEQRDEVLAAAPTMHLWWSADGISWEPIDLTEIRARLEDAERPPEEGPRIESLVGTEDAFYLFAGPRLGFRSTDGRTWPPFEMQGLPEEFSYGVSAIDDGFVIFGREESHGYFGGGPGEQSVWTSPDGRSWARANLDLPLELGPGLEFEVGATVGGPLGILVQGGTMQPVQRVESVEVVKDGYVVTMGMDSWTLADEATGEFIAETGHGIEIGDSPTGAGTFPIIDSATGEELLVITEDDIVAAEMAVIETVDSGAPEDETPPIDLLAFSSEGETWAIDGVDAMFGEGASVLDMAVGTDHAVVLVLTDFDGWMEYMFGDGKTDPPPIDVWVAQLTE